MPQYTLVNTPKPPTKIPKKVKGTTARVTMTPAGKAFLTNRAAGKPTNLTPAGARAAVLGVRPIQRPSAAVSTDPIMTMANRLIANQPTAQQLRQQAQAAINAQIKLGIAGYRTAFQSEREALLADRARELAREKQQEARARTYATAIASLANQAGQQVKGDYNEAAQNITGLGTGLTGEVLAAQQAEARDAAERIAAATGGLGLAKGLDVEGMHNVSQYTGVTQPATDLFSEAANRAALARFEQGVRAAGITKIANDAQLKQDQTAADYQSKLNVAGGDLRRQLVALQQSRPALYQQALAGLQGASNQNAATIISALALANTTAKTPSEIAENEAGAAATTSNAAATTTNAGTNVAKITGMTADGKLVGGYYFGGPGKTQPTKIPTGMRLYTEGKGAERTHLLVPTADWYWAGPGHTNPTKIPKGSVLDPKDPTKHTLMKDPNVTTGSGTSAATAAKAKAKAINTAIKDATKAAGTATFTKNATDPIYEGIKPDKWVPTMPYAKAREKLLNAYVPKGLRKNARILAAIDNALAQWGYKIPSKGGAKSAAKPKLEGPSAEDLLGLPK